MRKRTLNLYYFYFYLFIALACKRPWAKKYDKIDFNTLKKSIDNKKLLKLISCTLECHVAESAAEAYSVVALNCHGQPLPQKRLFAVVAGDSMGPPANVVYEVGAGRVDGAEDLKGNGHEGVP